MIEEGEDTLMIPKTLYSHIDEFSDPESEINKMGICKIPKQLFFDGKNLSTAVSFQLGDLLDPDLCKMLEKAKLADVCHEEFGWYTPKEAKKIRSVFRYKYHCVSTGKPIESQTITRILTGQRLRPGPQRQQRTAESNNEKSANTENHENHDDDEDEDDDDYDADANSDLEDEEDEEHDEGDEDEDDDGEHHEEHEDGEDGEHHEEDGDNREKQNQDSDGDEEMKDASANTSTSKDQEAKTRDELEVPDDDIFSRLHKFNLKSENILDELEGFLKQGDLMPLRKPTASGR
ncbi:unnamed protein product [Ambrosiozyma monospora]|uniref:Unnamed protein product n=1 Tax=Ambrosiozyma monospora TaxID=43982 RepID=A0ACB5TPP2_AMBMO|nr:unnamed protein product [Ambrosiozyma monospora]